MYDGGGDQYVHADIHSITFRNFNSNEFVITSDGGIFYTNNAGLNQITFNEHNKDYNTLQYYTGDINPDTSQNIFIGGLQDNGTLLYSNQSYYDFPESPLTTNSMISGGDGAYCFWDKNESNLLITSTYYNRYYLFNNGEYTNYFNGNNGTFISPADYDYNNNTLYANAVRFDGSAQNRIFRISNIDTNPTTSNINLNTNINVPFSHVKYSKHSLTNPTLFIGSQSGYLFKISFISNNNFNVSNITGSNFPLGSISSISIGGSEDTLLVTFSNYGVESLWLSNDGGNNWEPKEGNLPDMPIRSSLFHPNSSNHALIATEIGVWGTVNLQSNNTAWTPLNNGLANVRVDMINIRESDNLILASSHGRGQFYGYYNIFDEDIYGDLNNDFLINVLDIVLLVNFILNNESYSDLFDINDDDLINVIDVVILVNLILDEI